MDNKAIKVLLVDDDTTLGNIVTMGLTHLGFKVHYISSLIAITSTINEFQPSVLIFDVEIGDKDGIDESTQIRRLFPSLPIIFISSHVDPSYIIRALDSGCMTYLKKPFTLEELAAYVKRFAAMPNEIIAVGDYTLNSQTKVLLNCETREEFKLSTKECDLLSLLIKNKEMLVTRDQIFETAWNGDDSTDQTLNNNIAKLRRHFSSEPYIDILTVSRLGYKLTCKV